MEVKHGSVVSDVSQENGKHCLFLGGSSQTEAEVERKQFPCGGRLTNTLGKPQKLPLAKAVTLTERKYMYDNFFVFFFFYNSL